MPLSNRIFSQAQDHVDSNAIWDVPASTLAAQIADNITQGKIIPKNEDKEQLQKLLQEILQTYDESEEVTENVETRVDVNHRLIYVVVRVGLEYLFSDNPFNDKNELRKQAYESLSVVELTLRRSPEVLFSVLQDHGTELSHSGPLYLWLIPRLFMVPVQIEDSKIYVRTLQVLQTALRVERKPSLVEGRFRLIMKYAQGCVKGKPSKSKIELRALIV